MVAVAALLSVAATGCDGIKQPSTSKPDASLRVGTYNIRYSAGDKEDSPNAWNKRKSDMVDLIVKMNLDAFGLQEVCPNQTAYLMERMPQYSFVGEYRNADRKSGEASPVFWRKDRFDEDGHGTFWLSETPEVPGRKSWGAACPRVCTWVRLRDKRNGKAFCFVNTHTDHMSKLACEEGLRLILMRMKEFAPSGMPVIFTGDHNTCETWAPAKVVAAELRNSLYISETPPVGPWRTCIGWTWKDHEVSIAEALKTPVEIRDKKFGYRIDYIYVSDGVKVKSHATIGDSRPGKQLYPSDHFPVMAVIELTVGGDGCARRGGRFLCAEGGYAHAFGRWILRLTGGGGCGITRTKILKGRYTDYWQARNRRRSDMLV